MQRNLPVIIGVFVFACVLLLLVLWVWWALLAPAAAPPTPTSIALFVTPTQATVSAPSAEDSPTLPPTIVAMASFPETPSMRSVAIRLW